MADATPETIILAQAIRFQKMVGVEAAHRVLSEDIVDRYGASPSLSKMIATAALDGDAPLVKDLSSHINPKDKHYSAKGDLLGVAGASARTALDLVQSDKKHEGFEKRAEPKGSGDANPGVKKSEEDLVVDTKARGHLEKAFEEFQKVAGPDCGHCNSSCSCGRGIFKQALGMFKADDKPEKKDESKEGGDKKEVDAKNPMAGGGDQGVPEAPEELPMPATGGIAGGDVLPMGAPDAAPPAPPAPPASDPVMALQTAGQIAQLVNETVSMINELIAPPAPPMDPMMDPAAMDPMADPLMSEPPMPDTTPQMEDVPPGGAKGMYLDDEGDAEKPPKHGIIAQAHALSKALNVLRVKNGTPDENLKFKKNEGGGAMMTTGTPGAAHEVIDGSLPKAKKLKKALEAARSAKKQS